MTFKPSRRQFFPFAAGLTSLSLSPQWARGQTATTQTKSTLDSDNAPLDSITQQTLWNNLDGTATTWFHPRACLVPTAETSQILMTLQEITGSDYFGPVHFTLSTDQGQSWTSPQPIPALGRRPVPKHPGLEAGVCDVVPQFHPHTNTVLALGHVVFYRGPKFSRKDQLPRYPVYAVRDSSGNWGPRRILAWNDPRGAFIYSNNCGQRVITPDGDVIMAFTFGANSSGRSVAGVRCTFDGETLQVAAVGNAMTNTTGRGFLEPSVVHHGDRYWMTIRAEDDRGYVTSSDDGLAYDAPKPWCWDDGEPLVMSTTQQHFVAHSDGLFLVYTRRDHSNQNVIRWRSPLWIARVDCENRTLIRSTEQIAVEMRGDGINDANNVPLMGNFNINHVSPEESWVTVGSWRPRQNATGAVQIARLRWQSPNAYAHRLTTQ